MMKIKKLISILVFLYILGFNLLIFSRIIPYGLFFALFSLILGILLQLNNSFFIINKFISKQKYLIIIYLFIISIIWFLGFFNDISTSFHQNIIYALIILLFPFFLYVSNQELLSSYKLYYIIISIILSVFGFSAWLMIFLGILSTDLYVLDLRNLGMHIYSWPYYLGLVLTNVDISSSQIGDILFYRSSGYSEEPAWAATFIIPAIIYLAYDKIDIKYNIRKLYLISLILFWISCAAVSSIISVILLIFLFYFFKLLYSFSYIKLIKLIIFGFLMSLFITYITDQYDLVSGFVESKLNNDAQTYKDTESSITWILHPEFSLQHFIWGLSLISGIIIFSSAIYTIYKSKNKSINGYILLYLFLQGAKRGWVWFSFDTFTLFFLLLMINDHNKNLQLFKKVQLRNHL